MDIWLDSGVSWRSVLAGRSADVYVEGLDQFTGWFQSSLMTSVALQGTSPYRSIFVHGFVVDEFGRKMSKSLGNVVDPKTVTEGGADLKKQPAYGVDTLRWWVASHATQHTQIVVSKQLLDDCHSEVLRLRNTFKFLLGAISDLEKKTFHVEHNLNALDKYMVRETQTFLKEITEYYDNFSFNNASKLILNFVSNQVSALYVHCVKDRLYCSGVDSDERKSAQLVLHTILIGLCRALGPMLPCLTEEVWSCHPLYEGVPFFKTGNIPVVTHDDDLEVMSTILDIRKEVIRNIGKEKIEQLLVEIKGNACVFEELNNIGIDNLCEIMQVSEVKLSKVTDLTKDWEVTFDRTSSGQCLRCRRYSTSKGSDICLRCEQVLRTRL